MDFPGGQTAFKNVPMEKTDNGNVKVNVWDSTTFWETEENKEKRKGGDNKENSDKQKN